MESISALPMRWAEVKPSARRSVSQTGAWPAAASIVLHGFCLLALVNWNRADEYVPQAAETVLAVEVVQPHPPVAASPAPAPATPPQPPPARLPRQSLAKRANSSLPVIPPAIEASPHVPSVPAFPVGATAGDVPAGSESGSAGESTAGRNKEGITADSAATPTEGNPLPLYPVAARRAGREGRVVLLVRITPEGACAEAEIAESSGTPSLDEAAKATVRHWRFHPAIQRNQKVEATLRVPVSFLLRAEEGWDG